MKHVPVHSSNIESVAHKGTVLHVKFKNGSTYEYQGVSQEQFADLLGAHSVGKHLHSMGLKGRKVLEDAQ